MAKRILNLLLCFVLCFSMLPVAALAKETEAQVEDKATPEIEAVHEMTVAFGASESFTIADYDAYTTISLEQKKGSQDVEADAGDDLTLPSQHSTDSLNYELDVQAPCDEATKLYFDLSKIIPLDAKITAATRPTSTLCSKTNITYTSGKNEGSFYVITRTFDEPRQGSFVVTLKTSNYGNIYITINLSLYGKWIVDVSAAAMDALYDGQPHSGYLADSVSGYCSTLETAYEGSYTFSYATSDGTPLESAPTEIGDYILTIAISEDNSTYKGSRSYNFSILPADDAQAEYQTEEGGEWIPASFDEAVAYAYTGSTVRLLKDVYLDHTSIIGKNLTVTGLKSARAADEAYIISSNTDGHGYLLAIYADVTMKNIIIDGGSKNNISAARGLIAVGSATGPTGKLTLGSGCILRNNNNTTVLGAGGGAAVLNGELVIDGATISDNTVSDSFGCGGGIYVRDENAGLSFKSGSISNNSAGSVGGGIFLDDGSSAVIGSGASISGNRACLGAGIYMDSASLTVNGGSITDNSVTNLNGTGYYGGQGGAIYATSNTAAGFVTITDGRITGNRATKQGGALFIDVFTTLNISGGEITGNSAEKLSSYPYTTWAGGIEAAPYSIINISGSPVIRGNTSDEETDGGVYIDYGWPTGQTSAAFATVNIDRLGDSAKINMFTWNGGPNKVLAYHAEGHEISDSDLSRLHYLSDTLYLTRNSEGNLYLTSKKAISVSVTDISLEYTGSEVPASEIKGEAWYNDEQISGTWSWVDSAPKNVIDNSEFKVKFTPDNNEYLTCETTVNVTITKRTLTVKALDKSAYVGDEAPDLSAPVPGLDYTISGLIGDDELEDGVEIVLSYGDDLDMNSIGSYDIIPSVTGEDSRYDFAFENGTLHVAYLGHVICNYIQATAGENGSISPSGKIRVYRGNDRIFTITADEGYIIADVKVDGVSVGAVESYTFTNVTEDHSIEASFEKAPEAPSLPGGFEDVPEDSYYKDAVDWAVNEGIINGTGDTTFEPDKTCTRAQAVTILWRSMGCPEPENRLMPFEDVPEDQYYYTAVLWASENGITLGTSATTFSPDEGCTRAHIVTFLWRTLGMPEISADNPFTDISENRYYYTAVLWAVAQDITNGTGNSCFEPDADCLRCQIVTFIYRAFAQ